ncbi:MAG: penicillin-insensitive murein endopeptidase [Deltaproteobacteria bacterium]|nr:MAG: penicillin-insensitive murein endopeptidase [Deltaproteobacteria bacterium]
MRWLALAAMLAGCAELGVVSDGTSISVGKASHGYLIDGARLPDHGEGFITRDVWRARDNRFGTDELIDLVIGVARRMRRQVPGVNLVVADLSGRGGGERIAFHRSHQSGRDADLLYYMRDAAGRPFEPDAMHVFNAAGRARDGSGITVDIPRTWLLVKELITASEAPVQWVFMYEPIARKLIEHAQQIGEPEALIERARKICRQPGDSARHDDHMHVRVYCSDTDKAYGCVDMGPMELLAEYQAEPPPIDTLIRALASPPPAAVGEAAPTAVRAATPTAVRAATPPAAVHEATPPAGAVSYAPPIATATEGAATGAATDAAAARTVPAGTSAAAPAAADPRSLGRLLRTRADRLSLPSWR